MAANNYCEKCKRKAMDRHAKFCGHCQGPLTEAPIVAPGTPVVKKSHHKKKPEEGTHEESNVGERVSGGDGKSWGWEDIL